MRISPTVAAKYPSGLARQIGVSPAVSQRGRRSIAAGAARGGTDPRDTLTSLSVCDFGDDGRLLIGTLHDALTDMNRRKGTAHVDAVFGTPPPELSDATSITAPTMRRIDGKYRANQLSIMAANTPSTFYDMLLQRRDQCWRALSDGYLHGRVFFLKLWVFMMVEVLNLNPYARILPSEEDTPLIVVHAMSAPDTAK
eukprot:COSAG02_NODE_2801_length_8003_cov_5.731655_5_plen_197_part_00